jgi:ABC-type branched-subunit amino acid transport system substrate-binding protein
LRFATNAESAAGANLASLLNEGQIFALVGSFIAGAEKEIVPLLADREVPLIGPFTLYPQTSTPLNRQVFYLLSGVDGQARALVEFAGKKPELKASPLIVVYPRNELNTAIYEAIKDEAGKIGLPVPERAEYVPGQFETAESIRKWKSSNHNAVLFLGGGDELQSLLKEADRAGWFPWLFLPGSSGGSVILDAPAGFDARVFLSFPTSPVDQSADGIKEFRAFAEKYKLPAHHLAAQVSAYSAAKILVEGLKRAGKDLSREKLIQALEGLYQYQTGLTPAITFGPNRRVGANGAHVVTIDLREKRFLPASGWIDVK